LAGEPITMSTVIVVILLVLFMVCLAVVVGRLLASPDPWDRELETMAPAILAAIERREITLPRRPPWHPVRPPDPAEVRLMADAILRKRALDYPSWLYGDERSQYREGWPG
jgi:hypothetical protein